MDTRIAGPFNLRKGGDEMTSGKVYLVGAGPGDPNLITVKGLICLRQADVVIYDRLVDESILHETPSRSEKIYVGKTSSHHTLDQKTINQLLVKKAKEGKRVVRLKGGDPFVLGRGGEEAEALVKYGIPFEVVPGISSSVAVPAYAGIPVTHRGVASSFTVVTGHKASSKTGPEIAWGNLATSTDTLVILMGMKNLTHVVTQLIKDHKNAATRIAVITEGTTPRQRCVTGTLQDIVEKVQSENLKPPSVVVIGEVVRFRQRLRWFDKSIHSLQSLPLRQGEGGGEHLRMKKTKTLPYYPIFLNIQNKECAVIGGGQVALRKVRMLLSTGANVTIISPSLHPGLARLVKSGTIRHIRRGYRSADLKGAFLVIGATDDKETNHRVAEAARKTNTLMNVVDDPESSDFILPSYFRRGNLTLAVSTGGVSPAFSRKIRMKLHREFGKEYGVLLSLIGEIRSTLMKKGVRVNATVWQKALDLDLLIQLVKRGELKKTKSILLKKLGCTKT